MQLSLFNDEDMRQLAKNPFALFIQVRNSGREREYFRIPDCFGGANGNYYVSREMN